MAVTPDTSVVERVKTLAAAESRPVLSDAEVTASIQANPMPDIYGLTIVDDGWTPTWHIPAIVSELWGIKAGKVAGDFTFSADGSSFNKGDVLAQCLTMEAKYAAMVGGSAPTGVYARQYPLSNVVVNG
jgi:hypothetical protein